MSSRIYIAGKSASKGKRRGLRISSFSPASANISGQISFTSQLQVSKSTSAAVYDSNGNMIRRLWDNVRRAEGSYTDIWDGKNDDGIKQPPGTYTVKMAHHNLQPVVGKIGNSSAAPWGNGYYSQFRVPKNMRVVPDGTAVISAPGYTEADIYAKRSLLSNYKWWTDWLKNSNNIQWICLDFGCDSTYGYFVWGNVATKECGITKHNLSTGSAVAWSGLTPDGFTFLGSAQQSAGANYGGQFLLLGTNSSVTDKTYEPTRIAVGQTIDALAVCLPNNTEVRLIHKVTGATASTIAVAGQAAAFDPSDVKLWVAVSNDIYPYTKADWTTSGSASTGGAITHTKTGTVIDLATNWAQGEVAAVFGGYGSSQQIVGFDDSTYNANWTLGQSGGYATETAISNDRFRFGNSFSTPAWNYPGCISFQDDGTLWVYQPALGELFPFTQPHIDATIDASKRQEFLAGYIMTTAVNDATRVIGPGLLGFVRDYTQTPVPGTDRGGGAWTKDRFWGDAVYDSFTHDICGAGPAIVYSGRLYAVVTWIVGATNYHWISELTDTGFRQIEQIPHTGEVKQFWDEDFNRYYPTSNTVIVKKTCSGLDGSNNPIWSSAATYVTVPNNDGRGPVMNVGSGSQPFTILSDGAVSVMGRNIYGNETLFHFGVLDLSGNWRWRGLREAVEDLPWPTDGRGTVSGNSGPVLVTMTPDSELLMVSWPGEFYYNSQACAHLLFTKDGQFLSVLGDRSPELFGVTAEYPSPLQSGNANSGAFVIGNDSHYHYLINGENKLCAVADVDFQNGSSLVISSIAVALGSSGTFGVLSQNTGAPDVVTGVSSYDDIQRADSSSPGGDWTDPNSSFEVVSNMIRGKTSLSYNLLSSYFAYRSGSFTNYCQAIYLPSLFGDFGHQGNPDFVSFHRLGCRFNPGTGLFVGAQLEYRRYPNQVGAKTNGAFRFYLVTSDGSELAEVSATEAAWLDPTPGHLHSLLFGCAGTSPTSLWAQLWDVDERRLVAELQTSVYDPQFTSAGNPVLFLSRKAAITRWEALDVTKTRSHIPFRVP